MSPILLSLIVMGALGIAFGLTLALSGRFFHVETDPRIEHIAEALPGINCGACGYAGCDSYAEAVAKGAAPDLCVPGGHDVALAVAHVMGAKLESERQPVRAVVHCQGGTDRCGRRFEYHGIEDCNAAHLMQAGGKECEYGCLGYGTCASVCPFGAITMRWDRIPMIDWEKCSGCGTCARACPRSLIETIPITARHFVSCSSQDRGKEVKQTCAVGCIACWLCVKVSPEGSIEKEGNLPKLTYPADADYAAAQEKCPMNCFVAVERPRVSERPTPVAATQAEAAASAVSA